MRLAIPLRLEPYVTDVLMRDLVEHDRCPSAFLVYLTLYSLTYGDRKRSVRISLKQIAERTGLSKSAVQAGMRILVRRQLVRAQHASRTSVPEYSIARHWAR
jgi:DNA-binding MarR family transcriptional regulator